MEPSLLFTVGHSNLAAERFLAVLAGHGITRVLDVRRWPRSRRHPQFDRERLAASLAAAAIGYEHLEALGGMREARADSPHGALAEGFLRGYADHMATPEATAALAYVVEVGARERAALMCAEANPEHCHRSLLADALLARGTRVIHLLDAERTRAHVPTAGAVLAGGRVAYPPSQARLPGLG